MSQPPHSVRQLARLAKIDFNHFVRLRYWIGTAENILQEAEIYEREGNDEQTYILLMRFADLCIRHLPHHPEANTPATSPETRRRLQNLTQKVPSVMDRLERIKARIDARYDAYNARLRNSISYVPSASPESSYARPSPASSYSSIITTTNNALRSPQSSQDGRWTGGVLIPESLQAGRPLEIRPVVFTEDQVRRRGQLARELSERELERRMSERSMGRRRSQGRYGGFLPTVVGAERREDYDPFSSTRHSRREPQREEDFDLASTIKSLGRMSVRDEIPREREKRPDVERHGSWNYNYPTVPRRSTPTSMASPDLDLRQTKSTPTPSLPPKVPRKIEIQMEDDTPRTSSSPPPIPKKELSVSSTSSAPPIPSKTPDPIKEAEEAYTFSPVAYLENGTPLRTLFLPINLRSAFLNIASPNTRANLETCGLLCGTLISNALFISQLVIPEQEATSDTCTTKDEEELFDYVFGQGLMVLGWIHTHPSQTCFMSSVDLHTQCSYQRMLEESVAVVCAPRSDPEYVYPFLYR
ncbi:Mov34-domain-containing protein [Ascobolus immersus RN42]|uniref:Mov34-domain-containing protein n=1 Tax=Ascobolus immersus RN42 TaxID=1160509 RepID=A0A3N4I2C6_ASCIM|nr:Mov34-domain-containing protein [Ascobolus immersus RN42]